MKEPVPSALRRIDHTLRVSSQAKTDRDYDLCPGVSGVWGSWILREAEAWPPLMEGSEERAGLVGRSEAPDSVEIYRSLLASWGRLLAGAVEGVPSDHDPTPGEIQAFPSFNSVTSGPSRIVTSEIGVLTESSEQSDRDAAFRRLIGRWVAIAMSHVTVSEIDDPERSEERGVGKECML